MQEKKLSSEKLLFGMATPEIKQGNCRYCLRIWLRMQPFVAEYRGTKSRGITSKTARSLPNLCFAAILVTRKGQAFGSRGFYVF
jgi:hypothetical protein